MDAPSTGAHLPALSLAHSCKRVTDVRWFQLTNLVHRAISTHRPAMRALRLTLGALLLVGARAALHGGARQPIRAVRPRLIVTRTPPPTALLATEAAALFGNVRIPAALVAGAALPLAFQSPFLRRVPFPPRRRPKSQSASHVCVSVPVYLGPRTACLCVQCGQCDLYLHSVLRTRRIMVVRSILSMRMPMRTETHKQPHRTSSSLNPLCPLLRSHMYLATSKPSLRVS